MNYELTRLRPASVFALLPTSLKLRWTGRRDKLEDRRTSNSDRSRAGIQLSTLNQLHQCARRVRINVAEAAVS
jgi:hypothetical protein